MNHPAISLKDAVFVFLAVLVLVVATGPLHAAPLEVQKVTDRVYALVGEMDQRNKTNLGNNATFGVVVTDAGVVLIDPGGTWKGAQMIDKTLRTITDRPVKIVINTGGQDHRWLGNGYWREKGAKIIAANAAIADQKERGSMQLSVLGQLVGDEGMAKTKPAYAELGFDESHEFALGGVTFQIRHKGAAHTPGDSYVIVPSERTLFSGDIVYLERLLGVGPQSDSASWVKVFKAMAASNPRHLVPGHGHAADLKRANRETLDYLLNLRKQVAAHLEKGGEMKTVVNVDQSAFKHLRVFASIAKRNAMAVFAQMEFE